MQAWPQEQLFWLDRVVGRLSARLPAAEAGRSGGPQLPAIGQIQTPAVWDGGGGDGVDGREAFTTS
jgi:hypothetical protein